MFVQFMFCMLMEDLTFYWSHSALHSRRLYWIHKQHHEYTSTVSISATYAHPLEYFFSNVIPAGIGYHILGKLTEVHFCTIIVWIAFRLVETCEVHCGYEWSWRQMAFFRWKLGPNYHDFHHSNNSGNYGSMF